MHQRTSEGSDVASMQELERSALMQQRRVDTSPATVSHSSSVFETEVCGYVSHVLSACEPPGLFGIHDCACGESSQVIFIESGQPSNFIITVPTESEMNVFILITTLNKVHDLSRKVSIEALYKLLLLLNSVYLLNNLFYNC